MQQILPEPRGDHVLVCVGDTGEQVPSRISGSFPRHRRDAQTLNKSLHTSLCQCRSWDSGRVLLSLKGRRQGHLLRKGLELGTYGAWKPGWRLGRRLQERGEHVNKNRATHTSCLKVSKLRCPELDFWAGHACHVFALSKSLFFRLC